MTIKQEIPNGWVVSKLGNRTIDHVGYPHKTIITDWLWRNRHAEPIQTIIIPAEFAARDAMIADYYQRLNIAY